MTAHVLCRNTFSMVPVLFHCRSRRPLSWFSITFGSVIMMWLTERGAVPPWLPVAIHFSQIGCQQAPVSWVNVVTIGIHFTSPALCWFPAVTSYLRVSSPTVDQAAQDELSHPPLSSLQPVLHPSPSTQPSSWLYTAFISENKLLGLSSEFLRLLKPKPHRWHWIACVCMFVHAFSEPVPFVLAASHICLGNISSLDWDVTGWLCFPRQLAFSPDCHI